jgi:hypothetical protein
MKTLTKHIESREDVYNNLIAHAKKLHVSESVLIEIEEQKVFLSTSKMRSMINTWDNTDFNHWYAAEWTE